MITEEKLINFERILIFLSILFLPLFRIPQKYSLPILGGNVSKWFYYLSVIVIIYEFIKFRFRIPKNFIIYVSVLLGWQILCSLFGIIRYPYSDYLTVEQFSNFQKLSAMNLVSDNLIILFLYMLRAIKYTITENFQYIVLAFLIWHIYQKKYIQAFKDIRKIILILSIILCVYSTIELSWLKFGSDTAKWLLTIINPILYDPASGHGWWPPLLWIGRVRSLFPEPSFFGIVAVFSLPFLWSYLVDRNYALKEYILFSFLIFYFTILIAATNARTAVVITVIELFLLFISTLFVREKRYAFQVFSIIVISLCAFGVNLINPQALIYQSLHSQQSVSTSSQQTSKGKSSNPTPNNKKQNNVGNSNKKGESVVNSADKYVDRTITSLVSTKKFSNNNRLAYLLADLDTIKENPIMGVGLDLKNAYIDSHIPQFAKENREVKGWHEDMLNRGIFKGGYPSLNKYADIAAETGIIGLVIFLGLDFYVLFNLLKLKMNVVKNPIIITLFISMIAMFASGISNSNYSECIGYIIGILLCFLHNYKFKDLSKKENYRT
ncbi:O-antigen ligase family protein [uncultured Dialister sp.]|jgi:hypothetical protein|uniref:O-antigen ligase family protein n=1 Tax=uncultured Dialister sp. TaxID=278064 RepID=UPI002628FF36|nr:O-antigen ligase family protein [uncultured Dialister sp.]